jgi:hypothetical protein
LTAHGSGTQRAHLCLPSARAPEHRRASGDGVFTATFSTAIELGGIAISRATRTRREASRSDDTAALKPRS